MKLREMKRDRWRCAGKMALCLAALLVWSCAFLKDASGLGWEQLEDRKWAYERNIGSGNLRGEWALSDGEKYYFDDSGEMSTGWLMIDGEWYFFCPLEGKTEGMLMTGWQWIDGRCYCLTEWKNEEKFPGRLYRSCFTPDGYLVGQSGAWIDETGTEVYVEGKGIAAVKQAREKTAVSKSAGRSPGGKSGGGGRRQEAGETGRDDVTEGETEENREKEDERDAGNGERESEAGEGKDREGKDGEDKAEKDKDGERNDKGDGNESGKANLDKEENVENGKNNQDKGNESSSNGKNPGSDIATPSEAMRVKWEIRFVEKEHHENQIFRPQSGETAEGEEVSVDFPEEIVGNDGYVYKSAEPGPKVIRVSGSGIQKYYIEFIRGEKSPSWEPGEDDESRLRLERWLEAAKRADREITGKAMEDSQIITVTSQESDKRLMNLISMIPDGKRHQIYLIAVNHIPSTLTAVEKFSDVSDISVLVMDEFECSESQFCVVRIGLKKNLDQKTCRHRMEKEEVIPAGCLSRGSQTERCGRCGFVETYLLPPSGHRDGDGDGICDVCDEIIESGGNAEPHHFRVGDIQMRTIGKHRLRFRCIDDDYSDGNGNNQSSALFLCDTVIRSDVDSDASHTEKLSFGESNNYKTSNVRKWLNRNASDSLFDGQVSYIGINTACTGTTVPGTFEQFDEENLRIAEKPFQLLEDRIFILSVEEAVKYREYLWSFEGAGYNNPETQISSCSRGYYLRTPQYAGETDFQYGNGIYAVDLINGNIHPADILSTAIGIRPVLTVRQSDS